MIMSFDESTQTKLKFYTELDYGIKALDDSYQNEKVQRNENIVVPQDDLYTAA